MIQTCLVYKLVDVIPLVFRCTAAEAAEMLESFRGRDDVEWARLQQRSVSPWAVCDVA